MPIAQDKFDLLEQRMKALNIKKDDIIEKFILGSGTGGQKINKTSSCVYLKHIPTGIQIKCQQTRSREYNRYLALSSLCDRIENKALNAIKEKIHLKEKIRRQNKKRTFTGQQKVMEAKKRQGVKKHLRSKPKSSD